MLAIAAVTVPYFALILCGYLARGLKIMDGGAPKALNQFVLYFALPALLIRTLGAIDLGVIFNPGFASVWAIATIGLFLVVLIGARLLGKNGREAAIFASGSAHGNIGYLGLTLVIGLLGAKVTPLVSMAIILDMTIIVPATFAIIQFSGSGDVGLGRALLQSLRAAAFNPFMVAILTGLAVSSSGIQITGPLDDFLRVLGMAAVPAALFAIGVTLYGQPMRKLGGELGAIALIKLMLHPIIVLFVATTPAFGLTREEMVVAVLLSALPVANNIFVIATRYDVRPGLASTAIFMTTTLAIVSFNLWAGLLLT